MKKSKSSGCRDGLSELPNPLILLVLSFLETKDVLRTTILSKHWKDLWNTVPCLNFKDRASDCVRFRNIVNRTLVIWKGTKILKFGVDFWYEETASSDVDLWLRFATENQVEELNVNLIGDWDIYYSSCVDTNYSAPQRLYACSSIRELGLKGCNLNIHGNVHWDSLKCLTIDCVILSKHVIDKVLFGAPQLEVLILRIREYNESLNIHSNSNSLKKLIVEKYLELGDDDTSDRVLKIGAPKLEALEVLGVSYSKYVLLNVSSLTKATVVLELPLEDDNNGRFSGFELIEDVFEQIYRSKRRVEQVTLPYLCIDKVFRKMMMKDMLAPLSYAKFLKLHVTKDDEILHVLEILPKLTVLVLEGWDTSRYISFLGTFEICCDIREPFGAENSKTGFPNSCLQNLMKVEIDWTECEINSICPVIEFLLKYSTKLEKLVLRVDTSMKLEIKLSTEKKLLTLPRSSPNADVVLC